ncbi:glycine betaine/L-proline ABC transporter permease ProW [Sedimenticola thiotaurini]|uniref:Glycine/betaine ABC transporter permease n=1 Tax=Sedimenticola thiotaurini TaxID=1543721 RepID=A0A0F7JWJ0_9GAMM|nr:glycine betaine/L-proline ABC transporter permease ProW [Sedimenticola thiotaurini]AKH19120.1 glycine/betaine ABC transporter permease [Sedimenticola thiotaurini]
MSSDNSSNPWAAASSSDTAVNAPAVTEPASEAAAANPWGGGAPAPVDSTSDWLNNQQAAAPEEAFNWLDPFAQKLIPLDHWVDQGLEWLVDNFRPAFQAVRWPIDATLTSIESALLAVPSIIMIILFGLIAWQVSGRRLALASMASLVFIGLIGAWPEAMVTLALVLTSVFFCILLGLPTGILLARNDRAESTFRPILDAMQTTPAFVYLVPVVMLFGIGNVPGVVVTIIFALPPLIRLTNLGIRQVPADLVEATRSFGASPRQLLFKVQLPLAMPTIMAGVNQTLMLALSMVVIASMIAVGGLGQMVLRGIGRLDMGLAAVGGVGIVLLAIVLDRITQSMGEQERRKPAARWYQTGPLGLVMNLFKPAGKSKASPK